MTDPIALGLLVIVGLFFVAVIIAFLILLFESAGRVADQYMTLLESDFFLKEKKIERFNEKDNSGSSDDDGLEWRESLYTDFCDKL